MTCHHIKSPDGRVVGIVCTSERRRKRECCRCGAEAEFLCDWKVAAPRRQDGTRHGKAGRRRTCSAPLCRDCALEVGADKHLCRPHQRDYQAWLERERARPVQGEISL